MPRSVRIEYAGARYHVMCRGDRQEPIFLDNRDREIFLATLWEACERSGVEILSFVLMENHYHLLLRTPNPNLVATMQWFQGTYTARFNARHKQRGHVFQGRYKAIPIDGGDPRYARTVSDYIHLNPVSAGLIHPQNPDLLSFRWSSFPAAVGFAEVPASLRIMEVLEWHHLDWKNPADRRRFHEALQRRARESWAQEASPEGDSAREAAKVERGWYLGSESFRDWLQIQAEEKIQTYNRASYDSEALSGHDERTAEEMVANALKLLELDLDHLRSFKKNDPRKQGIAALIRTRTIVKDDWISSHLGMGDRSNIRRAVLQFRSSDEPIIENLRQTLRLTRDEFNSKTNP